MTTSSANLATFDFLELLYMLAGQERTGVLTVYRPDGQFVAWIERGLLMHAQFPPHEGIAALVTLLRDPRGRFNFDEGVTHPDPRLAVHLDEVALEALDDVPLPELGFGGPGRLTSPERAARVRWTLAEQDVLRQIAAQRPVSELAGDPATHHLLKKLARIGLLVPRRSRVARLSVGITREVEGVVLLDESILRRWREDGSRTPAVVAIKTEADKVYTLPVRGSASLNSSLLLPPDLLLRTGLRVGDSVLVRPG